MAMSITVMSALKCDFSPKLASGGVSLLEKDCCTVVSCLLLNLYKGHLKNIGKFSGSITLSLGHSFNII